MKRHVPWVYKKQTLQLIYYLKVVHDLTKQAKEKNVKSKNIKLILPPPLFQNKNKQPRKTNDLIVKQERQVYINNVFS